MPQISLSLDSKHGQEQTFLWIKKKLSIAKDIEKNIGAFSTHSNTEKCSLELRAKTIKVSVKVKKKLNKSLVCVEVDLPFKLALLKTVIKQKLEQKISDLLKKIK